MQTSGVSDLGFIGFRTYTLAVPLVKECHFDVQLWKFDVVVVFAVSGFSTGDACLLQGISKVPYRVLLRGSMRVAVAATIKASVRLHSGL